MLTTSDLTIHEQFIGPPDLGNGGYVVGAMAEVLGDGNVYDAGAIEVTLRGPLPIGQALDYRFEDDKSLGLWSGDDLLATAKAAVLDVSVPVPAKADWEALPYGDDEPLQTECRHFLGACAGEHPALTDADEALRVLDVLIKGKAA